MKDSAFRRHQYVDGRLVMPETWEYWDSYGYRWNVTWCANNGYYQATQHDYPPINIPKVEDLKPMIESAAKVRMEKRAYER